MGGGGRAAVGDVRPQAVVTGGEARPLLAAKLIPGDGGVGRIAPAQRHLAVAAQHPEAARLQWRTEPQHCFVRGGADAARIHGANLEDVCRAAGEPGHGVAGGGSAAAGDVRPQAVVTVGEARACLVAHLVLGDAAVAGVGPGQDRLPVARGGREPRRFGRRCDDGELDAVGRLGSKDVFYSHAKDFFSRRVGKHANCAPI